MNKIDIINRCWDCSHRLWCEKEDRKTSGIDIPVWCTLENASQQVDSENPLVVTEKAGMRKMWKGMA